MNKKNYESCRDAKWEKSFMKSRYRPFPFFFYYVCVCVYVVRCWGQTYQLLMIFSVWHPAIFIANFFNKSSSIISLDSTVTALGVDWLQSTQTVTIHPNSQHARDAFIPITDDQHYLIQDTVGKPRKNKKKITMIFFFCFYFMSYCEHFFLVFHSTDKKRYLHLIREC